MKRKDKALLKKEFVNLQSGFEIDQGKRERALACIRGGVRAKKINVSQIGRAHV